MAEEFFSFKVLIHEIQLTTNIVFPDETYKEIENPAIAIKLLNFPLLLIKGIDKITRENAFSAYHMKKVFSCGRSSLFKFSEEKLKENLNENTLKLMFIDLDGSSSNKIKKNLGKCNISLDIFINELAKTYLNTEENFKRHCFKLFDSVQQIIGLLDISLSLVKRSITYLNRNISEKLDQKINNNNEKFNQENIPENPRFFDTFGKNEKDSNKSKDFFNESAKKKTKPYLSSNNPSQPYLSSKQNNKPSLRDNQVQTNQNLFINDKPNAELDQETLTKTLNLVNPSIKYMIEGNFCPPPMIFLKKSNSHHISPNSLENTQKTVFYPKKPLEIPNFVQNIEIPTKNLQNSPPTFQKNPDIPQKNYFIYPAQTETSPRHIPHSGSVIDTLIDELLMLRNLKQRTSIPTSPRKGFRTPALSKAQTPKPSNFIPNTQKISMKDLEKTPNSSKVRITEDYPEDFESASLSPSQLQKSHGGLSEKNSKSAMIPSQKTVNKGQNNEYTEDFDSYTISETINTQITGNKIAISSHHFGESKSLSDSNSNSQSNSQKKIVNCFLCGSKLEASKASEHLKICKNSNLRYSQKKNDKLISNSFKSIEEEEELGQKENQHSKKGSIIKESNKNEEYIDDFHSSAEIEDYEKEKF